MAGFFVTFEGGEGTGKSTQIQLLSARLARLNKEIVVTREPGGTPQAENIRNLLVSGDVDRWSATAEALLNYAARDSHLQSVIRPALARGAMVLCDRFMDSTRAYQGHAGGSDMRLIDALEAGIVGATRPDLTLIFDLDPQTGLTRAKARADGEDRYERKGLEFHSLLRAGFLEIARNHPKRCRIIEADAPIEHVSETVWQHVSKALG